MYWYLEALKNYAGFGGRARRREFWLFALVNLLLSMALAIVEGIVWDRSIVTEIYLLAIIVPFLAVTFRRLHDTGRSGAWALLCLIPFFGQIPLIIVLASSGDAEPNEYGPNPG